MRHPRSPWDPRAEEEKSEGLRSGLCLHRECHARSPGADLLKRLWRSPATSNHSDLQGLRSTVSHSAEPGADQLSTFLCRADTPRLVTPVLSGVVQAGAKPWNELTLHSVHLLLLRELGWRP